jgi:hypothetical protein
LALDQPFSQAALAAKAAFNTCHGAGINLVIVAEKVQESMQSQNAEFYPDTMPGFARLPLSHSPGNDDVAQLVL